MWMMGYNDGAELNLQDSLINGRKLRPLIPRPSSTTATSTNNNNTPCLSSFHGTDLLSFNHHLGSVTEQSKKELNTQHVVVSSRWNPTPEQLQILEELYRRGTRTPSTDHIQHITAQLRRYGKIEGKNVFYWFQNHKARERQKRRRQRESPNSDEHFQDIQENIERKELGANRTGIEVEQTKNWAHTTNCSTFAEKSARGSSMQSAGGAECRAENIGRIEMEEGESMMNQITRSNSERNATWQMMQYLSCSSTVVPPTTNSLLINPSTAVTTTTTNTTTVPTTTVVRRRTLMDPKLIKPPRQDLSSIFIGPHHYHPPPPHDDQNQLINQTLELFPLRSNGVNHDQNGSQKETHQITIDEAIMNPTNLNAPCQFFEFLPLKN